MNICENMSDTKKMGLAWLGLAGPGSGLGPGPAWLGLAWLGWAWDRLGSGSGLAWLGLAWLGLGFLKKLRPTVLGFLKNFRLTASWGF